jgi:hypothetical protein
MAVIFAAVTGLLLLSIFPSTAYAYIDPGTAGMALQALIGGVVGALFVVRLYWQKIKIFFGFQTEPENTPVQQEQVDD